MCVCVCVWHRRSTSLVIFVILCLCQRRGGTLAIFMALCLYQRRGGILAIFMALSCAREGIEIWLYSWSVFVQEKG